MHDLNKIDSLKWIRSPKIIWKWHSLDKLDPHENSTTTDEGSKQSHYFQFQLYSPALVRLQTKKRSAKHTERVSVCVCVSEWVSEWVCAADPSDRNNRWSRWLRQQILLQLMSHFKWSLLRCDQSLSICLSLSPSLFLSPQRQQQSFIQPLLCHTKH